MTEQLDLNDESNSSAIHAEQPEFPEGGCGTDVADDGLDDLYLENTETDDAAYGLSEDEDTAGEGEQPPLDLDTAIAEYNNAYVPLKEAAQKLYEVVNSLDQEIVDRLDTQVTAWREALDYKIITSENIAMRADAIREHMHEHEALQAPEIQGLIDAVDARLAELAAAQEQANVLAKEEYYAIRHEVANTTNWESVIEKSFAGSAYDALPRAMAALSSPDGRRIHFVRTIWARDQLQEFKAVVEANADTLEGAADIPPESQQSGSESIKEAVEWYENTTAALDCLSPARRDAILGAVGTKRVFKGMKDLCHMIADYHDGQTAIIPSPLARTIEKVTAQIGQRCDAADEAWIHEYLATAPDKPQVKGQDLVRAVQGVEDIDAWVQAMLDQTPQKLRQGVHTIEFRGPTKNTKGTPLSGWVDVGNNVVNIVVGTAENPSSERIIAMAFTHEMGHYAHRYTMPLHVVRKWAALRGEFQREWEALREELHQHFPSTNARKGQRGGARLREYIAITASDYTHLPDKRLLPECIALLTEYYGENLRPPSTRPKE